MTTAPAPSNRTIRIFPDIDALSRATADEFVRIAREAVQKNGKFSVAVAGGSTPKTLNNLLVTDPKLRDAVPWDKMSVFFGDERHVGPGHPDSNYQMVWDTLISKSPLQENQIFRIKGEFASAADAALEYEAVLRQHFGLKPGEFPVFDLVFFGIGDEGHTLSLFPGTRALQEKQRLVVHNWVGKLFTDRITMTAETVNHAANAIFMVKGDDKALAVKGIFEGPYEPEQLPSQLIRPKNGKLFWFLDKAAGSQLSSAVSE